MSGATEKPQSDAALAAEEKPSKPGAPTANGPPDKTAQQAAKVVSDSEEASPVHGGPVAGNIPEVSPPRPAADLPQGETPGVAAADAGSIAGKTETEAIDPPEAPASNAAGEEDPQVSGDAICTEQTTPDTRHEASAPDTAASTTEGTGPDDIAHHLQRRLSKHLTRHRSLDERIIKHIRKQWDALPEQDIDPECWKKGQALLEKARDQLHRQIDKRESIFNELKINLAEFEKALEQGVLIESIKFDNKIKRALREVQDISAQRRKAIDDKMDELQPKLRELKAWRHWGVSLAREELITKVENLIGSGQPPGFVAREIQGARKTWREWDLAGDSPSRELWQRFDAACTQAYEPCKAFFAKQAEQRKAHREIRENICRKLEALYADTDWTGPNWRNLDRQIQRARTEWHKAGHVDRKLRKPLTKRFEAILGQFEDYMARERKRCMKHRQFLVEQVEAVAAELEADDTDNHKIDAAVEQVKTLQNEWRVTVPGKRGEENRLWKAFKAAGDSVFSRRKQQQQEFQQAQNQSARQKQDMIKALNALAECGIDELAQLNSRLAQAQDEWKAVGAAGNRQDAGLERQFRQALKRLRSHREKLQQQSATDALHRLGDRATLCEALESQVLQPHTDQAWVTQQEQEWVNMSALDEPLQAKMDQRFQRALGAARGNADDLAAMTGDLEKNLEKKRSLCLQLEILCGIDSPPEYAKARMALQIQRLSAAMSGQNRDNDEPPLSSVFEGTQQYYLTGAVDPAAAESLQRRLRQILETRFKHKRPYSTSPKA